jgi:hypothetical protein
MLYLRVVFPAEIIISNGSQAGKLLEVFEKTQGFVICLRWGNYSRGKTTPKYGNPGAA